MMHLLLHLHGILDMVTEKSLEVFTGIIFFSISLGNIVYQKGFTSIAYIARQTLYSSVM